MKKVKIATIANTKAKPEAVVKKGCDEVSLRNTADVTVAGNREAAEGGPEIDVLTLVKAKVSRFDAFRVGTPTISTSRKEITLFAVLVT